MNFIYFDEVLRNAEFTDQPCTSCGSNEHCLDGEYFDKGDDVESVCLKCLKEGRIAVEIPEYIRKKIAVHLQSVFSESNQETISEMKHTRISELERTPPVAWIQYNDWLVCCGDFMKYLGEWKRDDFINQSPTDDGKETLFHMLDDFSKRRIVSIDSFWNDIGKYTAVFVFTCNHCGERKAVSQSY